MKAETVIKEVSLNAPVSKIWKALTDKDEMKLWYFDLKEFKPEVGFEFRFTGEHKEKCYIHVCKITEVIPEKRLSYSWRYEGEPGISYVTFELFAEGSKTKVKLTHSGLETFSADNPDLARKNFEAGWNDIIGRSLKEYAEKI